MIGRLIGTLEEKKIGSIILNVNNVGYIVYLNNRILHNLNIGETYSFIIDTVVREDAFDLYGFLSEQEQDIFRLLKSVQGVSNKLALTITSSLSTEDIFSAILNSNVEVLKTVSGVGAKVAQRVISELKDKISNSCVDLKLEANDVDSSILEEAVQGVKFLGYKQAEAEKAVSICYKKNPEYDLHQLIKIALDYLANNN